MGLGHGETGTCSPTAARWLRDKEGMSEQLVKQLAYVRRLLRAYRSTGDPVTLARDDGYWKLCVLERRLLRLLEEEGRKPRSDLSEETDGVGPRGR
jgi:hypothetical protein